MVTPKVISHSETHHSVMIEPGITKVTLSSASMTIAQYVDFYLTVCCLFLPVFDLQSTEQVAAFCRSLHEMNPSECVSSSPSPDSPFPPPATPRQLSDADKLRKVICELVETERTYVKVCIAHLGVMGRCSL